MERKFLCFTTFLFIIYWSNAQSPVKDFYLKKSLKQDGFQYQFTVLDEDRHGVWVYKKEKFYFWYKAQKVMSTQGGSSGQLLNGSFEVFHENKQLSQKGRFHKGLKDGKWMYWREDGTLSAIEEWDCGDFSGRCEYFNEEGELIESVCYKNFKTVRTSGDSVIITKRFSNKEIVEIKGEKEAEQDGKKEKDKAKSDKKERSTKKEKKTKVDKQDSFLKRIFKKKDKKEEKKK